MISSVKNLYFGKGMLSALSRAIIGTAALQIVGMILGFLLGVQLARGLGVEGYGIYGVAMSVVALLTIATEFGMTTLLTREVAVLKAKGDYVQMRGLIRWSRIAAIHISLLICLLVSVWIWRFGDRYGSSLIQSLMVGMFLFPLVAQISINGGALRGMQLIIRGQIPDVLLRPLIFSVLLYIFGIFCGNLKPDYALVLSVLAAALALFVSWIFVRQMAPKIINDCQKDIDEKQLWASSFPIALAEGMRVFQGQVSTLLAGNMLPMEEVGLYRVASSIAVILSMPITLFNVIGASMIARLVAERETVKLRRLLGLLALGMTAGVSFLVLLLYFFGEIFVQHTFGGGFIPAVELTIILGIGSIVGSSMGAGIWLLNMTGHQKAVTLATFKSLIFLLVSLPFGAFYFGVHGVAICTSICYVLWTALIWRRGLSLLGIDPSVVSLIPLQKRRSKL